VELFEREGSNSRPILIHHFLEILDQSSGKMTGHLIGSAHKSPYNSLELARRYRFMPYVAGPTSGIAINRALANLLFPLPDQRAFVSADDFIVFGASLVGELHSLDAAFGTYRVHGGNAWYSSSRRKSPEFVRTLDNYLNERLALKGLPPAISFYDSMFCWQQLVSERRWLTMTLSMLKLLLVQRDSMTLNFIYETFKVILNNTALGRFSIFRRCVEITRPVRIRLLGW
jgi:hypothetical protein